MEFTIRELLVEDCITASRLIHRVAETFIAPDFSEQGMRHFLAYVRPSALCERLEEGGMLLGAFVAQQLIAVLEMRDGSHISLLFTDGRWHGRGVARTLLQHVLDLPPNLMGKADALTVNASPYAVPIYRKMGFTITGPEGENNGVRSTPMMKILFC